MRTLVKRGRQLADWVILERKMYTILTVEDDLHINNLLKEALGKAGYACSQAFSGTEALLWLERNECQLILLDLMLPGLSGEEVLQQIRQTSNVPVIVLTAKGEMEEKLDLLTSGADDYMTKPFDVKEVIARVQIQLRHLQHGAGEESTHLKCRGMDLDKETHRVMIDGQELGHLTRQEFAILELLLEHPGQVFSKEAVFTYAWQFCVSRCCAKSTGWTGITGGADAFVQSYDHGGGICCRHDRESLSASGGMGLFRTAVQLSGADLSFIL